MPASQSNNSRAHTQSSALKGQDIALHEEEIKRIHLGAESKPLSHRIYKLTLFPSFYIFFSTLVLVKSEDGSHLKYNHAAYSCDLLKEPLIYASGLGI